MIVCTVLVEVVSAAFFNRDQKQRLPLEQFHSGIAIVILWTARSSYITGLVTHMDGGICMSARPQANSIDDRPSRTDMLACVHSILTAEGWSDLYGDCRPQESRSRRCRAFGRVTTGISMTPSVIHLWGFNQELIGRAALEYTVARAAWFPIYNWVRPAPFQSI